MRQLTYSLPDDPNKAFTAATTVGLALQACYFGHVETKYEVYSRVIQALVDARTSPNFGGKYSAVPVVLTLISFFSAQESLALSNLELFVERVYEDLSNHYKSEPQKWEEARTWLITGLLESGLYNLANVYLQRFRPHGESALTLLFPLRVGIIRAHSSRVLSTEANANLKELAKLSRIRLSEIVEQFRSQIEREKRTLDKFGKEEIGASATPKAKAIGDAHGADAEPPRQ